MKNILVIVGSQHQKGNTDLLADAFIEGAKQAGHKVTKFFLGNKVINGCLGCNACRYNKPCIQKDIMQDIYLAFNQADVVVMASPLYYWTISAPLKAFIERLYAVCQEDHNPPLGRYELYPHKECVLLITAADDFFWTFEQVVSYYQFTLINYLGWTNRGMILAGGCGGVDSKRKIEETPYLKKAQQLGQLI